MQCAEDRGCDCAHPHRLQVLLHRLPQGVSPVTDHTDVDADKWVAGRAGDGEGVPFRCRHGRHIHERVLARPGTQLKIFLEGCGEFKLLGRHVLMACSTLS